MRIVLLLLIVIGPSLYAKDKDSLPLNQKTGGQFVDPTTSDGPLLGKQKTPAVKKAEKPIPENLGEEPKPYIATLGTFGSSRINEVILKETLGKDLDVWIEKGLQGDDSSLALEDKLAKKMQDKFGFAFAGWSVIQFFEPGDLAIHITLDVVEKKDASRRMPFLPVPKGEFRDPDGILKAWSDYETAALDLVEAGQLIPETEKCPAFHCPFGHKHDKLKKYEKIFVEGSKKHFEKLVEIQAGDQRPEYRAAATYVLAYHPDGKKVVSQMVERVRDPDELVRNNALRVLGEIAEFHPELVIPTAPIVEALSFPRASDRSKAVFVAHMLTLNSQSARTEMLKLAVPSLLELLASKMPDQREFSHDILRKISGREYPPTDVAAWKNWHSKLPKERGVSQTK